MVRPINDEYILKYLKRIKECKDDESICKVLDSIYEDGFSDGNEE